MNDRKTRGHDENRGIICAACGKKDLKCAKVQPSIESAIQAEISKAYSVKDVYFPNGVCSQCRKWLFASKKNAVVPETVRERWNSLNFEEFRPPSRSAPCSCSICKRARYKEENLEAKEQADLPRKQKEEPEASEARKKNTTVIVCHKIQSSSDKQG